MRFSGAKYKCIATKGKFTQLSRSHNTTLVKGAEAEAKLRRNPLSCKMDEIKSEQFTLNLSLYRLSKSHDIYDN